MTGTKMIIFRLGNFRKTRQATLLSHSRHQIASTGQNLVRVALMANVPHQSVMRCIKQVMQRNRDFHRSQSRGEVTAGASQAL